VAKNWPVFWTLPVVFIQDTAFLLMYDLCVNH
jgi:hypothetical protein